MTSTAYRMIGTTNDVVTCARCGREELKLTVVLELLDAEGNGDGVTYFGSSCAAKALAEHGIRRTGRQITDEAGAAQTRREADRANAIDLLSFFRPDEDGAVLRYRSANGRASDRFSDTEILSRFAELAEVAKA